MKEKEVFFFFFFCLLKFLLSLMGLGMWRSIAWSNRKRDVRERSEGVVLSKQTLTGLGSGQTRGGGEDSFF